MIDILHNVKIQVTTYDEFDNELDIYNEDIQDTIRFLQFEYRKDKEEMYEKIYQLLILEEKIEVVDRDMNTSTYKVINEKKQRRKK